MPEHDQAGSADELDEGDIHLGAPVARLEMAATLEELSRRVLDFAVRSGADPVWKTRGDRRGLATLPMTLGQSEAP